MIEYKKSNKNNSISIVIPVYNSENTIRMVVDKIDETLSGKIKYEVVIINDGSSDNSYEKCVKITQDYRQVKFISLSRNFGQHNAIIAGLHYVRGDYIIFMDDDLQTPPEELWKFINKIEEGYDVVYANYICKQHSLLKNINGNIKNAIFNLFIKKPKDINITNYFVIRKFLVHEIIQYTGPFTFLSGLVLRSTNNIGSVDVHHSKREYGISNYSFLKLFHHGLNGIINFSILPLRISFIFGTFCSISGFFFSIFFLVRKLLRPDIILGWTSMIIAILFFSGIILIMIGIIGEYIGRIFLYLNKQPQYVIKKKINID